MRTATATFRRDMNALVTLDDTILLATCSNFTRFATSIEFAISGVSMNCGAC